jgi:FkbM family methyltransferase
MHPRRRVAFVLASTDHGAMIVNRFDHVVTETADYGVGHELMDAGHYAAAELGDIRRMLQARRLSHGDGVVALDIGANVGVFTLEMARLMTDWGRVLAFEPQERLFCALAGNIALNNAFNAQPILSAVGATTRTITVPQPDYRRPGSFGSISLRREDDRNEAGQPLDYDAGMPVRQVTIDSLRLPRVDLIKLDIEGMEIEALDGARDTVGRCRPALFIEHAHVGRARMGALLEALDYAVTDNGRDFLATPREDRDRAGPA